MRSSLAKVWQLDFSEFEAMFGHPLADLRGADEQTGEIKPGVTIVTDNGGPFRSFRFEAFIAAHPELTPRPNPGEVTRAEGITRTRTRHPQVRPGCQ